MKRLVLAIVVALTLASTAVTLAYDPGDPGFPPDAASHK